MQICNNCNNKLPSDNLNFCPNCGYRLKQSFPLAQLPNKKITKNRLRNRKLIIPIMAGLFISIMIFWIFIIPQINTNLTIKKPVLESITPISPIIGDAYQYLDFFHNSIYEFQAYPASIIIASFNANNTAIVSEATYPLTYNIGLLAVNGITKFTTNGNSSFVLTNWDRVTAIYNVINSNAQFTVGNQLNISCTQTNMYPSSTTYCSINDIQLIGSNLFILASYFRNSNLEVVGNILKVYSLITNKVTNVYSFPENSNVDIGIYQNEMLQIFFYNESSNLIYQFATYKFKTYTFQVTMHYM